MTSTLEQTGSESFGAGELNEIAGLINYLLLEWDPAYHPFLQRVKDKLTAAVAIKKLGGQK